MDDRVGMVGEGDTGERNREGSMEKKRGTWKECGPLVFLYVQVHSTLLLLMEGSLSFHVNCRGNKVRNSLRPY